MSQLQTNIFDIKIIAKNLAKELKAMKFDISHSSALNLASRSLGYNNYQTYKGLLEAVPNDKIDIENPDYYNEYFKQKAYLVLRTETTVINKINAIQKIMYSHFIRSALSALGQNRKHPIRFEEYASHWLYADIDMEDNEEEYAPHWLFSGNSMIDNQELNHYALKVHRLSITD